MAKNKIAAVSLKPEEEWQVENDLRTLTLAKEIQADPKRMAKVRAFARKKLESVATVLGGADDN